MNVAGSGIAQVGGRAVYTAFGPRCATDAPGGDVATPPPRPRLAARVPPPPAPTSRRSAATALALAALLAAPAAALAQVEVEPPTPAPSADVDAVPSADPAAGRPVVAVRVVGNATISDTQVLNAVNTKIGRPFDPAVVVDDYQRIYALRRFSRVEARYEVTPEGVSVVFDVDERPAVERLRIRGNDVIDDQTLRRVIERDAGQGFDPVLLALAQTSVERLYRDRNYALAQVAVVRDEATGTVTFDIVEGPKVRVRNVDFVGAEAFNERALKKQIVTKVFVPLSLLGYNGRYDERQIEEDVASLQRFYRDEGYFDARVGRRVVWSPDLTEVQVEFLVDEGPRYVIDAIRFEGNERLSDEQLALAAGIEPGAFYDAESVQRARQRIIAAYSPLGLIYDPGGLGGRNPDYLSIDDSQVFRLQPGRLELVFNIGEGKAFRVGNIEIRGNDKTQDKVILRQFDMAPGDLYDSADVQRATRRLLGTRYFQGVNVTPIGDDPESRDLLVEVAEQSTATLTFSGAVSSNGGLIGSLRYEQSNFDIADPPTGLGDFFGGDALVGGGQTLRILLEPGTIRTNASVSFFEPYFFDQNLGFGADAFYREFRRREYDDRRAGGRLRLAPRIGRDFRTGIILRGEDVRISDIDEPLSDRAPDILEFEGNTTLTSVGGEIGYERIDNPILPSLGVRLSAGWESYGVFGGPSFQKLTANASGVVPLYRDATDRPTVLEGRIDGGYIYNDAPFFERFYAGGLGSLRGFAFRGVSPRQGPDDDAVGGDFALTGSLGVGFPLSGESLRGVVFTDFGTVESDLEINTLRAAAGLGVRIALEPLGNVPIAIDFAFPYSEADEDREQIISFSLGLLQ